MELEHARTEPDIYLSSDQPERSFSTLLHRRRSKRSPTASSVGSIASSDLPGNTAGPTSVFRETLDKSIDKLRGTSVDPDKARRDSTESTSRLSRLVPSRSRRRAKSNNSGLFSRRKGSDDAVQDDEDDDNDRGRDTKSKGLTAIRRKTKKASVSPAIKQDKLTIGNASLESLAHSRSGDSSLLTEDSEPESSPRPPLISRQSHKGYLTLSSPLIDAETVKSTAATPVPLTQINTSTVTASGGSIAPLKTSDSVKTEVSSPLQSAASFAASLNPFKRDRPSSSSSKLAPTKGDPASPASQTPDVLRNNTFPSRVARSSNNPSTSLPASPTKSIPISISSNPELTPSTFITPPTPTLGKNSPPKSSSSAVLPSLPSHIVSKVPSAAQGEVLGHRRTRSATAASSKLRETHTLSTHIEEVKTPSGSVIQPSTSSGFFSSVFSATQNAVSSIGATFTTSPLQRTRSGTIQSEPDKTGAAGGEEVLSLGQTSTTSLNSTEPAVRTLGSGNLSLSHLGISDIPEIMSTTATITNTDTMEDIAQRQSRSNSENAQESNTVAEAVNAAYADKTPFAADNSTGTNRPRSIGSALNGNTGTYTPPGATTPPRLSAMESTGTFAPARSGSVRSRLSGRKGRPKRGSSGATGYTIAAAIGAGAALANPASSKPAGFAVANSKRNKDFHALFKSVPEDDYLVEDYSAALQRDILLQGRLYVAERHICFSSNILGWVTNLIVNFDEVIALEKKSTAMIFPNAIVIQTLHSKNVFASFISRDTTYDLLLAIWKINHPNVTATDNGHKLDDKSAEKGGETASDEVTDDEFDESDDDDVSGSGSNRSQSTAASVAGDAVARSASVKINGLPQPNGDSASAIKSADPTGAGAAQDATADIPGPASHGPTECGDQDTHYDKLLLDTTIPAPLGKVYSMMFGPQSGAVMRKFLLDDQKSDDLKMTDDKKGLGEDQKTLNYSYIKPLNGPIGPKQTTCLVTQTLDAFDLEKAVSVTCSTQTPDVPSGNVFVTKTRYCLMWGPNNTTRIIMGCTVEWSGKSWLKGPIEKGANDGQVQYGKDLVAFFKAAVSSKPGKSSAKSKVRGKKKRARSDAASSPDAGSSRTSLAKKSSASNWGPLEPLHTILSPLGSLIDPIGNPMGFSLFTVTFLWITFTVLWMRSGGRSSAAPANAYSIPTASRLAAYEELWRREESQLWDWLDDRLNLDGIATGYPSTFGKRSTSNDIDDVVMQLRADRMSERQMRDAIRVTSDRLESLKLLVEKKKRRDTRREAVVENQ